MTVVRFRRTGALSPRGVRRAAPQRQRRPHPRDSRSRPASLPRGRPSRSASFREESLFTREGREHRVGDSRPAGISVPRCEDPARPLALWLRRFRSTVGFRLPASGRFCEGSGLPAALRRPPLASRRAFYLFFYFAMLYLDLCFILRYLFISSCL